MSTPESRFATTTPWPVAPSAHSAGALTAAMLGSAGPAAAGAATATTAPGPRAPAGTMGTSSGVTLSTSARAAICAITAGVAVTETPLKIQNDGVARGPAEGLLPAEVGRGAVPATRRHRPGGPG